MQVWASETAYWSNPVTSVRVLSDPGLSHASVSSLFLCREKERNVWAPCLLLGVSSDGFNHSWVPSSFPSITPPHTHLCTLLFSSYNQYARQLWVTSSFFVQMSFGYTVVFVCIVLFHFLDIVEAQFVSQIHFNLSLRSVFSVLPKPPALCLSATWMHFYFACV